MSSKTFVINMPDKTGTKMKAALLNPILLTINPEILGPGKIAKII
jgi:hypothetical protein